jgi:hypothetical protein
VHQLFIDFKKVYDSVRRKTLYIILTEFGIPMNPITLLKMCLNELYSRVRVGKHLSDIFPTRSGLKQGDALSPLLLNFALEDAIRSVRVKENGLKLNSKYQHFVYGDDVNILGGSVHTVKNKAEALVFTNRETRLEVNADKTKYIFMSRDQNAGRSQNTKIDNNSFEMVEEFKYLGTTLTNQNSIQEEIKNRLKSGNACYQSVQKLLSSSLLSDNIKNKIHKNINLSVVLYGCETWSMTLREERRLRVFEYRVLRRIFGPKRDDATGEWRKLHNEELNDLYSSPNFVRVIK